MAQSTARRRASGHRSFSQHLLQRRHIHHLLGQQLLELGVLSLQRPQLLGIRHFHAAELGPALIESRIADTVLAAQILRPKPGLVFLQNADDLFFGEP